MSIVFDLLFAFTLTNALPNIFPAPIVSSRAPTANDTAQIGQVWIDKPANQVYVLTSVVANVATWVSSAGGGGIFSSLSVSPGPISLEGTTTINTTSTDDTTIGNATGDVGILGDTVNLLGTQLNINLTNTGDTSIGNTTGSVDITGGNTTIGATTTLLLNSTGDVNIEGAAVDIEAGGSFDLFAQFLQAQKLTIHRVNIHPQRPVSLNPFADGLKILDTLATLSPEAHHHHLHTTQQRLTQDLSATEDPLDAEETPRDRLGEMVMAALLMITGGEAREEAQITRADRALLVDAIVLAARTVRDAHRKQMIASVRVCGVFSPISSGSGCDSGCCSSIIVRVRAARAAASGLTPGRNRGIIESSLGLPLAQPPPCRGFSLPGPS